MLLVTGAMGHVGYAVARRAAADGRLVAQYRETFREADARSLDPNVTWVACDLTDAGAVEKLARDYPIDACIHLAAVSNEAFARPHPLQAIRTNIGAVANLLDVARVHQWRRFLYVGTGSVFQRMTDPSTPILEDAPTSAEGVYATTKFAAERLVSMYRSQFGLSAATVRISWVYGPPVMTDAPTRGPIPVLLAKALAGIPIRDPSGGDFAASFTYVGDAAAGLIAACNAERLHHDIYHLGPGVNFSARQVASAVRAAVPGAVVEMGPGTEPWTTYTTMRGPLAGDRLQADTGFTLAYSLEQGIHAYAQWMRANFA